MAIVTLRIIDGADRGTIYDSLETPITIGREEGNVLQLKDERVSRFHVKIQEDQDKIVLTDLESTNGTRVNGEDIHLRILRHGDLLQIGRSVVLYGSENEIADRLALLRQRKQAKLGDGDLKKTSEPGPESASSLEFELNWNEEEDLQATIYSIYPPDLPDRLSPAQAAQLAEILEYIHIRIRHLLLAVSVHDHSEKVTLEMREWQNLLDLQARISTLLRNISEPE
ncbi:MAG: FHA domain-containing protein [Blastopirellula sp.]|nr:MAG: FHA domain-containing protein [Blastopirellula sp.]